MNYRRVCMLVAIFAAGSGLATDRYWQAATDGDASEGENWTGGAAPTAGEMAAFAVEGKFKVTLSSDMQTGELDVFGGADVTFDLGSHGWSANPANKSLMVGAKPANNSPVAPSKMTLVGGSITNFYAVRLGNAGCGGNMLVVNGDKAFLKTGSDDYYVGNNYGENTLIVTNGARAHSGRTFRMGVGSGGTNVCIVTGVGTELSTFGSNQFRVGERGSFNTLIVEGGAICSNATCETALGTMNNQVSSNNLFVVRSGSTFWSNSGLVIGYNGGGNTFAVSNENSNARATNVMVGQDAQGGGGNALVVSDGALLAFTGHIYVGHHAESEGNSARIAGAGTVVTNNTGGYDISIGSRSDANSLVVEDGALVSVSRALHAGGHSNVTTEGGDFNTIDIKDEGTRVEALTGGLHLGKKGSSNTATVSDGAVLYVAGIKIGAIDLASSSADVRQPASSNVLYVVDGGIVTNFSGNAFVGAGSASFDNALVVSNATLYSVGYVYGNYDGTNNSIVVKDGGKVISYQNIYFGVTASAGPSHSYVSGEGAVLSNLQYDIAVGLRTPDTWLTVSDGARLYATRNIYVGYVNNTTPTNCGLIVSNASAEAIGGGSGTTGYTYLRYNATLDLRGSEGILRSKYVDAEAGCKFSFTADGSGFPVIDCTKATLPAGTKIVVNARKVASRGGGTFDLIRHKDNQSARDAIQFDDVADVTFDVSGCEIVRADAAVRVKVPPIGFMVIVR
ncbi:MAG: hypothetical protein II840_05660 [Kiritimatiellae bacterium]|nr:hypothetical protein [Kiritimatiellia bacterium]